MNGFGRLVGVSDASIDYLTGVTVNAQGLVSQLDLGNGNHETFTYNDRFQMISQSLLRSSSVLQKYDYSYGTIADLSNGTVNTTQNNGQLSKIEGTIGSNKQWSQRFAYDSLGRLSEAREYEGPTNTLTYKQVFNFDRFGNLYRKAANNSTSGQTDPLPFAPIEEATTAGTGDIDKTTNRFRTETTYDDSGSVIIDNKFRDAGFTYDANGRVVKVSKTSEPDARTVYDGLGNRIATRVNDIWRFSIYDAFGKLVAEYGERSDGLGGVKYIQQDWQGSVRTVANANGYIVRRNDHEAVGEDIGHGVGLRSFEQGYSNDTATRQGYGRTEKDEATGLDHGWFRKLEMRAGRWTSADPYRGAMSILEPQSFNRYSYVSNDPINFIDPTGLYEACVHEAMTNFLAKLGGLSEVVANELGRFTGDGPGGADSAQFAATSPANINRCIGGYGPSVNIHFPSAAVLQTRIDNFQKDMSMAVYSGYQQAGFTLHAIEDSLGAHSGYSNSNCQGHASQLLDGSQPDRVIGDKKFIAAANKVFQVVKNDSKSRLSSRQINALVDYIKQQCGQKYPDLQINHVPLEASGGPVAGGYEVQPTYYTYSWGGSQFDWLYWLAERDRVYWTSVHVVAD